MNEKARQVLENAVKELRAINKEELKKDKPNKQSFTKVRKVILDINVHLIADEIDKKNGI
jgi:hypothetical protein